MLQCSDNRRIFVFRKSSQQPWSEKVFIFKLVYCGHEYSIQNLSFGLTVEPENEVIKKKLEWSHMMRAKTPPEPTVPSTIGKSCFVIRARGTSSFPGFVQYILKFENSSNRASEMVKSHKDLSDTVQKTYLRLPSFHCGFSNQV